MRTAKYITLIIFSTLWAIGISNFGDGMSRFYKWGLIKDEFRFGDIYNLAHLPQFKEELVKCENLSPNPVKREKPVHLYVLGDSFLEAQRVDSSDFVADRYTFFKWDHRLHVKPDSSAINIVLIESVERHFRQHLFDNPDIFFIPDSVNYVDYQNQRPGLMRRLDSFFNSERINGQLELLLVRGNDLGLKYKELKSSLNFKVFGRTESSVTVSKDNKHIVYYLDTDTLNFAHTAGFSTIADREIDSLVTNINHWQARLMEMGFDHVVLAAIPNKSSIVMPDYGTYNRLIERVQTHPNLTMPYISIIDEFRAMGDKSYLLSDSHWTCEGQNAWLHKTNTYLNGIISKIDSGEDNFEDCQPGTLRKGLLQAAIR